MQSFSAAAKSLLQGGAKLSVSIAVNALSGALTITDEDIIRDSFVIDRNSVSGQTIEIGNVESTELSFLLENADRGFDAVWFEGAELTVTLTAGAESWVAGIFTVDKPPQGIDTIGIAALDHMARFDQPYSTSLTGKQTLLAILQDSCNTCGVTLGTTSFTNDSYLAIVPVDAQISHRQVLAWVAQLAGANAWIDHTGALRLSWYGENQGTTEIEVTQDDYNIDGYALAENDVSLSGLVWRTADADYLWGSDEYALAIEGNSLIDPDNYDAALTAVYNKIDGFFYRPYTVDAIPMPWVWPLDMIQLTTITGAVIPSIVTGNRIMLGDGSRLNGVGETATVTGYASYAPFTPSQQSVIQKTTRDVMRVFGIDAGWITVGILDADRIAAESINAFHLAADAVTTEKLAAGAVTAEEIAAGTITAGSAIIADGAITSAKIGDAQITTAKIEAGAITTALIDEAAIGTTQIADGSITDAKIVELTANKITSGQLTTDRLIIRDPLNPENSLIYEINNITGALQAIQGETLNGEVLTERTITADKIVANAITAAEIAAETITANEMAVGTITAASGIIADAAITTAKIADASITDAKISSLSADKITAGTIDANEVSIINLDVQTARLKKPRNRQP
jgi:hypothetical protein